MQQFRIFTFLGLSACFALGLWSCEDQPSEQLATTQTTSVASAPATVQLTLRPEVLAYAEGISAEFDQIPEERKRALKKIALYVKSQHSANQEARLTFICTHNSRRSHISQIWASTAAAYYGINGVETYSGGTETTAFNPRAVNAMKKAGFAIETMQEGDNPIYAVSYAQGAAPLQAYSKKYDADGNPTENFCAVMTCSEADKNCPVVAGASLRVAIPYEDPKAFDGTDQEAAKYTERSEQIAREMLYLFSQVKG